MIKGVSKCGEAVTLGEAGWVAMTTDRRHVTGFVTITARFHLKRTGPNKDIHFVSAQKIVNCVSQKTPVM